MVGINISHAGEAIPETAIKGLKGGDSYKGIAFFLQKVRHGYRVYNYSSNPIMTKDYNKQSDAIQETMDIIDAMV